MAAAPQPGDLVIDGLLYRWVPNTDLSFDYQENKPSKLAFRPDKGESGISVFLVALLNGPGDVVYDLPGYGVCEFTAQQFLAEVRRLRERKDNKFDQDVTIHYEPTPQPVKGRAHCYIQPMPAIVQKALYKRVATMTPGFPPAPAAAGFDPERDP